MVKKNQDRLVAAGRVRRAWGIKGQLSVDWNNGTSPVRVGSGTVYLGVKDGEKKAFKVKADRTHGSFSIVSFEGVESRDLAEELSGALIFVDAATLPTLGANEYYSFELIDMKVLTLEGEYLGEIKKIFPTGANDVYVVEKDGKELLIPAIADVVKKVDVENGEMVIDLIEGLR